MMPDAVYDPNTIPLHHIICDQGRDGLCLDFKTYYYVGLDTETSDKDKKIARILEVAFASLVDKVLFSGKLWWMSYVYLYSYANILLL